MRAILCVVVVTIASCGASEQELASRAARRMADRCATAAECDAAMVRLRKVAEDCDATEDDCKAARSSFTRAKATRDDARASASAAAKERARRQAEDDEQKAAAHEAACAEQIAKRREWEAARAAEQASASATSVAAEAWIAANCSTRFDPVTQDRSYVDESGYVRVAPVWVDAIEVVVCPRPPADIATAGKLRQDGGTWVRGKPRGTQPGQKAYRASDFLKKGDDGPKVDKGCRR